MSYLINKLMELFAESKFMKYSRSKAAYEIVMNLSKILGLLLSVCTLSISMLLICFFFLYYFLLDLGLNFYQAFGIIISIKAIVIFLFIVKLKTYFEKMQEVAGLRSSDSNNDEKESVSYRLINSFIKGLME